MLQVQLITLSLFLWQAQAAPLWVRIFGRATPEPFVLPPPGNDGPGPTFDATATRAATGARIRNAASPNLCFDVSDFRAGDFRFNLVPIALKPCDSTVDGQRFDLITKGEHNNVPDGSRTIIVSSQQLTCVDRRSNINDRTRPGLFACGGRAAGDGETTVDQQYFFNSTSSLTSGIGFPLVRDAVNNGVGQGNQCLTLDKDGFLRNTACSPPLFTPEQTWFVENSSASSPAPSVSASSVSPSASASSASRNLEACTQAASSTVTVSKTVTVTATFTVTASATSTTVKASATSTKATASATSTKVAASTTSSSASTPASSSSSVPEKFVLPKPAEGPGPTFDQTATRAATSKQIRNVAQPDLCFDVSNFRAGDFRFNLVPIALKKCDASVDGQKFDLITKGEHNNVQDGSRTIIVSSQQFTCVDRRGNINDRTRPGLFACGGRAAGDGETSFDQQFFFNSTADLTKGIGFATVRDAVNNGVGAGNQCLTLTADGFLSNAPCAPPLFSPEQTWVIA